MTDDRMDLHALVELAAELVGATGLALADALRLRGVQRIDFPAALPMVLVGHPHGEIEQRSEALLAYGVAVDLAADVMDHPAEPGAQEGKLAAGAVELMGVGVATDHDGDPPGALAQHDAFAPGQRHQLLDGAMRQPGVGVSLRIESPTARTRQ